jgi:hypothetical protein
MWEPRRLTTLWASTVCYIVSNTQELSSVKFPFEVMMHPQRCFGVSWWELYGMFPVAKIPTQGFNAVYSKKQKLTSKSPLVKISFQWLLSLRRNFPCLLHKPDILCKFQIVAKDISHSLLIHDWPWLPRLWKQNRLLLGTPMLVTEYRTTIKYVLPVNPV